MWCWLWMCLKCPHMTLDWWAIWGKSILPEVAKQSCENIYSEAAFFWKHLCKRPFVAIRVVGRSQISTSELIWLDSLLSCLNVNLPLVVSLIQNKHLKLFFLKIQKKHTAFVEKDCWHSFSSSKQIPHQCYLPHIPHFQGLKPTDESPKKKKLKQYLESRSLWFMIAELLAPHL